MCCRGLLEMQDAKTTQKIRHLGTIAQLCRAECSQLRHVSTIGKKLVRQQYLLHMSSQYIELWPTSDWDRFGCLGHPSKFQRVLRLGFVTARHSSSGRQPNFAALNRGRQLYSAGRPSRWALAHILVNKLIDRLPRYGSSELLQLGWVPWTRLLERNLSDCIFINLPNQRYQNNEEVYVGFYLIAKIKRVVAATAYTINTFGCLSSVYFLELLWV